MPFILSIDVLFGKTIFAIETIALAFVHSRTSVSKASRGILKNRNGVSQSKNSELCSLCDVKYPFGCDYV